MKEEFVKSWTKKRCALLGEYVACILYPTHDGKEEVKITWKANSRMNPDQMFHGLQSWFNLLESFIRSYCYCLFLQMSWPWISRSLSWKHRRSGEPCMVGVYLPMCLVLNHHQMTSAIFFPLYREVAGHNKIKFSSYILWNKTYGTFLNELWPDSDSFLCVSFKPICSALQKYSQPNIRGFPDGVELAWEYVFLCLLLLFEVWRLSASWSMRMSMEL